MKRKRIFALTLPVALVAVLLGSAPASAIFLPVPQRLTTGVSPSPVLCASDDTVKSGEAIGLRFCALVGDLAQKWTPQQVGATGWLLVNGRTGRCADVELVQGVLHVVSAVCNASENSQRWDHTTDPSRLIYNADNRCWEASVDRISLGTGCNTQGPPDIKRLWTELPYL